MKRGNSNRLCWILFYQSSFGLDEWPILSIHLVVEAAGVAEVVSIPVSPPQGSSGGTAIDTFAPLCKMGKAFIIGAVVAKVFKGIQ